MHQPAPHYRERLKRHLGTLLATALIGVCWARPSHAHVLMDTPKYGSTLAVGSTVVMTWEDLILHIGIGYDLDLIGPGRLDVTPIASGLSTSTHSYNWVVPNIVCIGCYLRVTQVNRDHDYESDVLVNIGTAPPDGSGSSGGAPGTPGAGTSSAGSAGATLKPPASSSSGSAGAAAKSSDGAGGDSASSPPDGSGEAGASAAVSSAGAAPDPQGPPSSSSSAGDSDADDTQAAASTSDDHTPAASTGAPSAGGCSMSVRSRRSRGGSAVLGLFAIALLGRRRRRAVRAR